ncbi:hypothetical protein [Acinetobacter sp.]|uniref:hypothetical protein n=1 Tax=Acinetobacter sp. TaxID=472 RepID=UPI0035B4DC81
MKRTILVLSLAALLTACGGSSDDGSSSGSPQPTTKTGVLSDGPVSGVKYISRNAQGNTTHEGTTSASETEAEKGLFQYEDGDTISFYVGGVKIGETAARAIITPLELYDDTNETARINLMIFLQSLDADQDHTNGIEISQATVDALADKTIDFTLPTESFEEDATLALAIEAAGTELVSEQDAKNNFFDSFVKDHTGAWLLEDQATGMKTVLYIDGTSSGVDDEKAFHFTLGEVGPADDSGESGIEVGQMAWNAANGDLDSLEDFSIDSNGEWGLSHPEAQLKLLYGSAKGKLLLKEGDQSYEFTKIENTAGSLTGSWKIDGQIASFFADGSYIQVSTDAYSMCGEGVESGTYSAANGTLAATAVQYDTNGCAGLVDTWGDIAAQEYDLYSFTYVLDGDLLSITNADDQSAELERF